MIVIVIVCDCHLSLPQVSKLKGICSCSFMELCEEQQQVIVVSFVYKSYLLFVEFVVVCVTGSVYSCIIF